MYCLRTNEWYLERVVYLIAGLVVLTGLALSQLHHWYWLALPLLAGINLIIFSLTGFCPMAIVLEKVGLKPKMARS